MEKYILGIVDRNGNLESIYSPYKMHVGDVIGWGADEEAPDGIMRWTIKAVALAD